MKTGYYWAREIIDGIRSPNWTLVFVTCVPMGVYVLGIDNTPGYGPERFTDYQPIHPPEPVNTCCHCKHWLRVNDWIEHPTMCKCPFQDGYKSCYFACEHFEERECDTN